MRIVAWQTGELMGVSVLGCDVNSGVIPSGVPGFDRLVHMLLLNTLGAPIMDNMDFSRIATVAAEKERWDFMWVIAPIASPGGTGGPVNALAIF
jgi:hypothetical protein